jgi:hypothetical protein
MRRFGGIGIVVWLGLSTLLAPSVALAEGGDEAPRAEDKAAAEVLFTDGRSLMDQKKYDEACAKFTESQRLDPAYGTQMNLARCYELQGKTASSWINYVEAAAKAKKDGRTDREQKAREFADAIKPQLSWLTITVPNRVPGLEIRRDGSLVREGSWGTAAPSDPGKHEITASAPGFKPWAQAIEVPGNAGKASIEVAKLELAPEPAAGPKGSASGVPGGDEHPSAADNTTQIALGSVAGVLGLGGLALGTAFGIAAGNQNDDSMQYCPTDPTVCDQQGVDLRDKALTSGNISTVGFVVGSALLVTGVVVLATAFLGGEDGAEVAPAPGGDTSISASGARWRLLPMVGIGPSPGTDGQAGATTAGVIASGQW